MHVPKHLKQSEEKTPCRVTYLPIVGLLKYTCTKHVQIIETTLMVPPKSCNPMAKNIK